VEQAIALHRRLLISGTSPHFYQRKGSYMTEGNIKIRRSVWAYAVPLICIGFGLLIWQNSFDDLPLFFQVALVVYILHHAALLIYYLYRPFLILIHHQKVSVCKIYWKEYHFSINDIQEIRRPFWTVKTFFKLRDGRRISFYKDQLGFKKIKEVFDEHIN
jgi:hypothetical protein